MENAEQLWELTGSANRLRKKGQREKEREREKDAHKLRVV